MARQIEAACREHGFFYVTGHGITPDLQSRLAAVCTAFFALPLHGRNLFSRQVPGMRAAVLGYLDALTSLGQAVLRGVALSLGLDAEYFAAGYTASPTVLFRVFRYPATPPGEAAWGVGEHTDYGLLTLLAQDDAGGLQVRTPAGWVDAPPLAGTFVANIGDMLDRLTGGWYRSTPHRVRNASGRDRLSFPFFLDPASPPRYRRSRAGPRSPRAGGRAGTGRTCMPSPAPTATTCSARWARCSRSSSGRC